MTRPSYRDHRDRYRAKAAELDFEGHMKWADGDAVTWVVTPSAARSPESLDRHFAGCDMADMRDQR